MGGSRDDLGIVSILSVGTCTWAPDQSRLIEMVLMRGHNVCFIEGWGNCLCVVFGIPYFLELCHPTHSSVGVLSASVSIRSMLLRCEDCLSHVPYQSDIRTGMEPVRDCPWCGLIWLVSCRWPQSGEWAGKFIFWFFAFFSILRVLLFRFVKD